MSAGVLPSFVRAWFTSQPGAFDEELERGRVAFINRGDGRRHSVFRRLVHVAARLDEELERGHAPPLSSDIGRPLSGLIRLVHVAARLTMTIRATRLRL
jgi:hypothetical protein